MRLFIAINFDEGTKEKLLAIQDKLKASGKGNFSRPENLHLTVLFLGEVQDDSAVRKSIDRHFHTPVNLVFNKTGQFKGNLYWAGIQPDSILSELYHKLHADLVQAGFQLDRNARFSPHITLAREVVLGSRPDLSFDTFTMTAKRLSLMKSERLGGRLVYTEVYGKSI